MRVRIEDGVCYLDVELWYPEGAGVFKGWTVRPLKSHMIWVQTGVSQVGFYLQLFNVFYFFSTKGGKRACSMIFN